MSSVAESEGGDILIREFERSRYKLLCPRDHHYRINIVVTHGVRRGTMDLLDAAQHQQ